MESYPITEDESVLDVCCFKEDEDDDENPEAELVQCTGTGCKFNDFKCCVSSMGLSIIRCFYLFANLGMIPTRPWRQDKLRRRVR